MRTAADGAAVRDRQTDMRLANNYSTSSSPASGRLHHIGFVVRSIGDVAEEFSRSIGGAWDGRIILDPLQGVRVSFLTGPVPGDALVELVEPAAEGSPVENFLQKGGGLHHLCYEAGDLEKQLQYSRSAGALIVRPPLPATAFDGRRIAWVYTKAKLLVEYLEMGPAPEGEVSR
ncbi:MAG: VOC family protein [Terriglobia bacterium]